MTTSAPKSAIEVTREAIVQSALLSAARAMENYTLLTIGDGLVTQMPALMISTASGIIVSASMARMAPAAMAVVAATTSAE